MVELSLAAFWVRHRRDCRLLGPLMADARAGLIPGTEADESAHGSVVVVVDPAATLEAIRKLET